MTRFALIHGTTQSPAGWDLLSRELRGRGHEVTAVDLPSDQPGWRAADYVQHAADQVVSSGNSLVVVAHSGTGSLLPSIAEHTGASAAVWLAAYTPALGSGRSLLDDVRDQPDAMFAPDWIGVDPTSDPKLARRFLFHDCDPATQRWALETLRLFSPAAVYEHAPGPMPDTIARAAIVPLGDRTLRPEWMLDVARHRLGIEPVAVESGHCPHVSRPQEIAGILTDLVPAVL